MVDEAVVVCVVEEVEDGGSVDPREDLVLQVVVEEASIGEEVIGMLCLELIMRLISLLWAHDDLSIKYKSRWKNNQCSKLSLVEQKPTHRWWLVHVLQNCISIACKNMLNLYPIFCQLQISLFEVYYNDLYYFACFLVVMI